MKKKRLTKIVALMCISLSLCSTAHPAFWKSIKSVSKTAGEKTKYAFNKTTRQIKHLNPIPMLRRQSYNSAKKTQASAQIKLLVSANEYFAAQKKHECAKQFFEDIQTFYNKTQEKHTFMATELVENPPHAVHQKFITKPNLKRTAASLQSLEKILKTADKNYLKAQLELVKTEKKFSRHQRKLAKAEHKLEKSENKVLAIIQQRVPQEAIINDSPQQETVIEEIEINQAIVPDTIQQAKDETSVTEKQA